MNAPKFDFQLEHDGTLTSSAAVYQALGAASVCWDSMEGTGVFDEQRARAIGTALLSELGYDGDELVHPKLDGVEETLSERDVLALQRFTSPNFAVKDARGVGAENLRRRFHAAAEALILAAPDSKSRSVALTELETAMMWAVKAYYGAPGEATG